MAALAPLTGESLPLPGVTTRALPGREVWMIDSRTGEKAVVGRFDPALPGPANQMRPVEGAFDGFGAAALARAACAPGTWASVDEVGYLEADSPAYRAALTDLLGRKRLLATVRRQDLPFLRALCRRADVFCVDLDAPFGRMGCVVMASGLGRRFGGGKLLAPFRGRPLLDYALDATDDLFARRVAVTRSEEAAAHCRGRGVEAVLHGLPARSDAVRLGLEAVRAGGELDGCLFCPADQPLLRRETVTALVLAAAAAPGAIWRADWQGEGGAPVLFPAWAFGELAALPTGRGGGWVAARHPERVRLLPVWDARELADVDSREDLAALEALDADRADRTGSYL